MSNKLNITSNKTVTAPFSIGVFVSWKLKYALYKCILIAIALIPLGVQGLLQLSAGGGVQADALVEAGYFVLDLFGQGGAEGAVGLFLGVAAQADEVFVGHVLGCGVGDDES